MRYLNRLFIPANNIEFRTGNEVFVVKSIEIVNYGNFLDNNKIQETKNLLLKIVINDEERIILPFFLFANTMNLYDSLSFDYLENIHYFQNGIPRHNAIILLKNDLVLHPNTKLKCFLVDKSNSLQYFYISSSQENLTFERDRIGIFLYGYWLDKYEKQDLKINIYPYEFKIENYSYLLKLNEFDTATSEFIATSEMKVLGKSYNFQRLFVINNTHFISYGFLTKRRDNTENYRKFSFYLSGIEYINLKRKVEQIYLTDYSAEENITTLNYLNNQFTYYDMNFILRPREALRVILKFVFSNHTQNFLSIPNFYSRLIRYINNNLVVYPFLYEFHYE